MTHTDPAVEFLRIDGETIETTPDHRFLTDHGWIEAGALWPGTKVQKLDGSFGTVQGFSTEIRPVIMWDLTVSDVHTFAVGEGEWVVHNCGFGDLIAEGHAWEEHGKFVFNTQDEFAEAVEGVIHNADDVGAAVIGAPGRTVYWSESGMIVIVNPAAVDGGTAFFGDYQDFLDLITKK